MLIHTYDIPGVVLRKRLNVYRARIDMLDILTRWFCNLTIGAAVENKG